MEDFILKGPLILIIMRIAGKRKHTHAFTWQKCIVVNCECFSSFLVLFFLCGEAVYLL